MADANRMVRDGVVGSQRGLHYPSGQFRSGDMALIVEAMRFAGEDVSYMSKRGHADPSENGCAFVLERASPRKGFRHT